MPPVSWQAPALTLAIGALGAALFAALSFPVPYLTGPATAVTIAGLAGIRTEALPQRVRDVVFVILGLTIGQGVTPEVLDAIRAWPITLVSLAVSLIVMILATRALLVRYWSMDPTTAFLASSPGHLSYVLGLTEGVKADLKSVAIVQSIRVLALTLIVPAAIAFAGHIPERGIATPEATAPLPFITMTLIAVLAGYGLKRFKLPAAYLIGGMLVSIALHVTGLVEGTVNQWLVAVAFISLGALIGSRFSGVSRQELLRSLGAGVMVTIVSVVLAAGFAAIAAYLTGMDFLAVLIAFAPGGLETMAAMSVLLDLDPTFVASHHVARLLMLTVIVPLLVLGGRKSRL
ncbi:MAG: AbrB family transcriptional regulator [Hoeflea sp.]|uniref:AbrB family transcriptional regulator n=1 Tax=Hoeflea sp. TaxID=1940281 RepID=UPI0032EC432B